MNNNENGIAKALKKVRKYFIICFVSLFLFIIIICAVATPIIWVGNVVGGIFSSIGEIFAGDGGATAGSDDFATSLDLYQYENRVSVNHAEVLGCTLDTNYQDNHEGCFDLIIEDGTIDTSGLEFKDTASLFTVYMDSNIEEYFGTFDESIRGTVAIPTFYQIGSYEAETSSDFHLTSDDESTLIIGATVYENEDGTGCENLSALEVCVIYYGYSGAVVASSNAPSTSGLVSNYGFQISEDGTTVSYNYYQEIAAGAVYAMAGGVITSMSDEMIVLEVTIGNYDFTITYEGDFNMTYYPNAIEGLPIEFNTIYPQDLVAYTSSTFKVYVQYEDKYINPAILYDVENGWNFINSSSGSAGTTGAGGYTDVSGVLIGQRAYITTQVAFDSELWADVEFQLPFSKIIITQCPEVVGWGDGGNDHTALDFYNANGRGYQAVGSAIAGTVVESGYNSISGYFVTVQHESGVRVNYNHLVYTDSQGNTLAQPQVGDIVELGEIIGFMGDSGNVTGIHIHMNIYQPINDDNTLYGWINPMWLLDESEYTYLSGVSSCVVSK